MKKTIYYFALLALTILVEKNVFAQESTTTIAANANVVGDVTVAPSADGLQFGLIIKDSQKRITVLDGAVDVTGGGITGIAGNEKRGYFEIEGTVGTKLELKLKVPSELTHSDGSTSMDYAVNTDSTVMDVIVDDLDPSTGTDYTTEDLLTTQDINGGTFNLDTDETTYTYSDIIIPGTAGTERKIYMVIGGLVKASASQKAGVYSADLTLTTTIISD